jgi:hypothetical protein
MIELNFPLLCHRVTQFQSAALRHAPDWAAVNELISRASE